MTLPNVTFHQLEGGAYAVFMHLEQKVRTIFTQSLDAVHNRIVAVGVSEFGLPADAAGDLAAAAVAAHSATQDQTDHVALLQEELTQAQADHAFVVKERDDLQSELVQAKADIANLTGDKTQLLAMVADLGANRDQQTAEIARLNEALEKASPADAAVPAPTIAEPPSETKAAQ